MTTTGKYHFSPLTGNYRPCKADKRPCKYTALEHIDQQAFSKIEAHRRELKDFFGRSFNYVDMLNHDYARSKALSSLEERDSVVNSEFLEILDSNPKMLRSIADGIVTAEIEKSFREGSSDYLDPKVTDKERKRVKALLKSEL